MTDSHKCPECGKRMKLSQVRHHDTCDSKRRDCECGYTDKVFVRVHEEILRIPQTGI
jgi:hypothetical protein